MICRIGSTVEGKVTMKIALSITRMNVGDMLNTVAIIPARGGSKGIPHKNLQRLVGKPLVAHTIEQAQAAQSIGRVIVSTDDAEIGMVEQFQQTLVAGTTGNRKQ